MAVASFSIPRCKFSGRQEANPSTRPFTVGRPMKYIPSGETSNLPAPRLLTHPILVDAVQIGDRVQPCRHGSKSKCPLA